MQSSEGPLGPCASIWAFLAGLDRTTEDAPRVERPMPALRFRRGVANQFACGPTISFIAWERLAEHGT
jgi:hypothetical protein